MEKDLLRKAFAVIEEMDKVMTKCMREGMSFENQYKIADVSNDYYKNLREDIKQKIEQ